MLGGTGCTGVGKATSILISPTPHQHQGVCFYRLLSGVQGTFNFPRSWRARGQLESRVATGRWATAASLREAARARPRCTRAHRAPRASGLPWSGLAAAGRKEVNAAARLLAGASTRLPCPPTRPPATRRGVHGPPPLGGWSAAPPPPRDPRALPKFGATLCPRARARDPHPLPRSAGPAVPRAS